jgi:uncharacterized membrane protein
VSDRPPVVRIWDSVVRLREAAWLPPIVAAVAGCGLALVVAGIEGPANPRSIAIDVDRARNSLWAALTLLFTALTIVMAVLALIAQNMASRYSPRLLRVKVLVNAERKVLFAFTVVGSYIVTELVLERKSLPDDPAPPAALLVGLVLIVVFAVVLVWFINRMLRSIRVDWLVRSVGGLIVDAARRRAHDYRKDEEVPAGALDAPPGAAEVTAGDSGYFVGVDTGRLHKLAAAQDVVIAVEAEVGQLVVAAERIAWISRPVEDQTFTDAVAQSFGIARAQDPSTDVRFDMHLLVDIALMALSSAVNDPHTAEQCIDELTLRLSGLAEHRAGPRGRPGADGQPIVIVNLPTLGSEVEWFVRRILLYGAADPIVTEALLRLVRQLERVGPLDGDRQTARALTTEIAQASSGAVG